MSKNVQVLALNCTLKTTRQKERTSTDRLLEECLKAFDKQGASGEIVRVADHNVLPGVSSDEGEGDGWPSLRKKLMESDVLLLGTPIWVGQPSSLCKRVLERMDAFYDEKDDLGRMPSHDKLGCLAVVGNEDGCHYVSAALYQGLNDLGFTIPASAITYWVGEAMGDREYADLRHTPKEVAEATDTMVKNAVHLARLLKQHHYPSLK